MQTPLNAGSSIIIDAEKYIIQDIAGTGASSIVYYAQKENGRKVVVKEFYPILPDCKRIQNGSIIVDEAERDAFNEAMNRFVDGFETQFRFRNTNDKLANSISDAERIGEYNGTQYIVTSYMVGKSMDKVPLQSMFQLLKLLRAVAVLIKEYHEQGYLHLDIKPENIFRRSDTDDVVMLFDFDSIQRIEDIRGGKISLLSYSPMWAAPELRQGRMSNISEATDVFSIGATLFSMLFGRHITALDCRANSEWEIDGSNPIFENVISKTKLIEGLKVLFHNTIASNPKRRYQDMKQLIEAIDGLLVHANTGEVKLLSTFRNRNDFFIGREREMEQIDELLEQEKVIFIQGVGGIGKTELAKQYAGARCDKYDAIVFGMCQPDIESYVRSDKIITLQNWDEKTERTEEYYEKKIQQLKKICNEQRVLLIVDNLDNLEDDKLNDLNSLGCDVIVTTRMNCDEWSLPHISVGQIEEATELFYHYYKRPVAEEDRSVIDTIVQYKLLGHTMFVIIVANIMRSNRISPKEMLEKINNSEMSKWGNDFARIKKDDELKYDRVIEMGKSLFHFVQMSEEELYIMGSMALIPRQGIAAKLFKELLNLESYQTINELSYKGILQIDNDNDFIKLHPVVAEIFLDTIAQHREWGTMLLESLFNVLETEHGRYTGLELEDIEAVISEIIDIYVLKGFDYHTFRKLLVNRILYGRMSFSELWEYGRYPIPSRVLTFLDKTEKESFEYYKIKAAYVDIKILDLEYKRAEEYHTILSKLSSFMLEEAYVLRMHIITRLLTNDLLRACTFERLDMCRSLFQESTNMYKLIQEKENDMEVLCYCKKQLFLQAACIEKRVSDMKNTLHMYKRFRKFRRTGYEKDRLCYEEVIRELTEEIEAQQYYKELKEMYRLLYLPRNIDWKLRFADALIEVEELSDIHNSAYASEVIDIYRSRFGEYNRIVIEQYLNFADKLDEVGCLNELLMKNCTYKNIERIINYYEKALNAIDVFYGKNSTVSIPVHRELARFYRLSKKEDLAKEEYITAIELLDIEGTDAKTIWNNYWNQMEIHIEHNRFERALQTVEQAIERCSQMVFYQESDIRTIGSLKFFEIIKHCEDRKRFEKCIEMYIDIYIKKKGYFDDYFLKRAGDYYYEQFKYYEAKQCYQMLEEKGPYEFDKKKDEIEHLLKVCETNTKTGDFGKAKENINSILITCKEYKVKSSKNLEDVIEFMIYLIAYCEDMKEEELEQRIIQHLLMVFDAFEMQDILKAFKNLDGLDMYTYIYWLAALYAIQNEDFVKKDLYIGLCIYIYNQSNCPWEDMQGELLEFAYSICKESAPVLYQIYEKVFSVRMGINIDRRESTWVSKFQYLADLYNYFLLSCFYYACDDKESAIRISAEVIERWGNNAKAMVYIKDAYTSLSKILLKSDLKAANFFKKRAKEVNKYIK